MAAEAFPTTPAVGDKITAAQGGVIAKDAVIVDSGYIDIVPVSGTPTAATVTFNKEFPSTPAIQVSFQGSAASVINVSYLNASTTTVDVVVTRSSTTSTRVAWLAILAH